MNGHEWISSWLSLLLLSFISIQTVLADNIDLPEIQYDAIGQLGFAGAFAGISPFKDTRQFEAISDPAQSSVLINSYGTYELLASSNGVINTICTIQNGTDNDHYDIYIGGNFSMLNDNTFNNIARFDTSSNTFSPLGQGLDGGVQTLLCDSDAVYAGGDFSAPVGVSNDSLSSYGGHAATWVPSNNSWIPVPWKGFNGPVYTITRNSVRNTILFGGRFDATGDGQYFNANTSQIVNMGSPTEITSGNGAMSGNYSDPSSIVCNNGNASQMPWLLQDGVPGYWEASFGYPVQPSLFRIGNAHYDNRGTQIFSIIALGSNEYFELSYTNTTTHETTTCTTNCVLSNDPTIAYQDFTVLNSISTNAIRIQIDSWYGDGGGLSSVEIFESDIGVYPRINAGGNTCSNSSYASTSVTGNWQERFVYGTYQNFLTASIPASELATTNVSVTYYPSIPAQGVYTVYALTPGCVGSSSCNERTQVDLSMQFSPGSQPTSITIDQTTTSDQSTLIYSGFIAPASGSYRPSVTLTVAPNATATGNTVTLFAETLQFLRNGTNATMSGILEYSPQNYTQNIQPAWNALSEQLAIDSTVHSIDASRGNVLYVGGKFSDANSTYQNLVSYDYEIGRFVPLPNDGVNGTVYATLATDAALFVAGAFNSLARAIGNAQFNNLAMLSFSTSTWTSLEQGVDGPVDKIWLSSDNITLNVSGNFSKATAGDNSTIPSPGNGMWNISSQQWIQPTSLLVGQVAGSQSLNDTANLLAGRILAAQTYRADGAATLSSSSNWTLFTLEPADAVINTGVFWHNATSDHNGTAVIIGGRFQYNNISNLALYQEGVWTGIGQLEGEIKSLALAQDRLYVAGNFSGDFYGSRPVSFAIFDLQNRTNIDIGSVYGDNNTPGIVEVVKPSPDGKAMYIGGNFTNVGSLNCPSVCKLDVELLQWNVIASDISGHVYDLLVNNNGLVVVGDINVNNQPASVAQIANQASTWTASSLGTSGSFFGTPTVILEGPDQMIIGGSNESAGYIGTWDGQQFTPLTSNLGQGSQLEQIMFVPISSSPSGSSYPANSNSMLLIAGHLNLEKYGNVSAAIYDGSEWFPYALTSQLQGTSGLLRQIFYESQCCTAGSIRHYLPVPAVILISIAVSLGVIFLLVAAGLGVLFIKRRNADPDAPEPMDSYMPPQNRHSSLMDMLDAAQAGTLGAGAAAAIAGAAAGPSKEKMADEPGSSSGDMDSRQAAACSGGATTFAEMMAAATANANSSAPVSDESPRLYEAKYPFEAKEYGELGFESGEPIVVTDTSDNVWWMGYKDDGSGNPVSGLFPSNYVTEKKQV